MSSSAMREIVIREKAGMVHEGIHRSFAIVDGRRRDHLAYAYLTASS